MTAYPTGRALGVQEAYDALDEYGKTFGRVPLLLLLHAAVPQSFRADMLNLLKLNFLAHEAGMDVTVDADVLFSPLVESAAAGYYRLDPAVRRHCLALLDAAYRHEPERRTSEVARFVLAYADALERRAELAVDPLLAEYLAIQRWVALAFIDPAKAAEEFARALAMSAAEPQSGVRARLGTMAAALSIPLEGHEQLLAYARSLDAIARGDEDLADRLLTGLGPEEIRVGGVALQPARRALKQQGPASAQSEPSVVPPNASTVPPQMGWPSTGPPTLLPEFTRYAIRRLLSSTGPEILLLEGGAESPIEDTLELIRFAGSATNWQLVMVDFSDYWAGRTPAQVVHEIASQAGLDASRIPDSLSEQTESRYVLRLADWLSFALRDLRACIVLKGFENAVLSWQILDLIRQLLLVRTRRPGPVRFVLVNFKEALPSEIEASAEHLTLSPVTPQDVADYLRSAFRQRGQNVSEDVLAAATEEVLRSLPEGRRYRIKDLRRVLERAVKLLFEQS
jgi:hypothetical protein